MVPAVQNAMLQLSGTCNFRCRMCGHAAENRGMMSDEVFMRTLKDCKKCGIHTLIFAGAWGEPLLHPKWKEFIRRGIALGFRLILSTNGSRLDEEAVVFLASSGIHSIQVSFAGYDEVSYGAVYINGDFAQMKRSLALLKKKFSSVHNPPSIMINGIILASDAGHFVDATHRFLYELGYSDSEIQMAPPNNYAGKRKIDEGIQSSSKARLGAAAASLCPALRDVVGVFWDGRISACACLDNDGKMLLGNILRDSISEVRQGPLFRKMLQAFELRDLTPMEMCRACDVPYRKHEETLLLPSWRCNHDGIQIIEATYGWNCRHNKGVSVMRGNVTSLIRKVCDGKPAAEFMVNVCEWGDPAPGLPKDFSVIWRYRDDPKAGIRQIHLTEEAHGKIIQIPIFKDR